MSTPASAIAPRLIRPSKDGQEGEWSYLLHANGHDYIFPALVNELGHLKGLLDKAWREEGETRDPADPNVFVNKVIYWKASEWETKIRPHAEAWMNTHGFEWPDIPFPRMELRKIEDRGGEERVTEVLNLTAMAASEKLEHPTLMVYQFRDAQGEEGNGRRPLMQWWMEGFIDFRGRGLRGALYSVSRACERIADWGRHPELMKRWVEESGSEHMFKLLSLHDQDAKKVREEELRVVVLWVAFCRYIASLKTTYEGEQSRRGSRRSAPRTNEEALALEQADLFKTVAVLKSGVCRKPVATGTGTHHRYRYLVRGHERIVNGKSIWIKPQIRGQGEFLNLATGTEEAREAAKEIEPPTKITINVPADVAAPESPPAVDVPQASAEPSSPVEESPVLIPCTVERTPAPPERPSLLRSAVRAFLSFFRSRS